MKNLIIALTLNLGCILIQPAYAQVAAPAIRANFGVDGDLNANYFNGAVSAGSDDWFRNSGSSGDFVIDTTGSTYLLNQYSSNATFRKFPFFRGMRYPQMSVVNGKLLVDAVFIRDHHGDDSTVFAVGANKNGQHPSTWTTPVSQGVPDKTDILDMMMHVRRDGPSLTDPLWLFGGISMDATTGNRYFDFEMYQTDIVYNRPTFSFTGFGPSEGHTAWEFDASGNITKAGDVIFTAEFGSDALSLLEARIWVNKSALSMTPVAFNWGGQVDGATAGSTYGYANVLPKAGGEFYTGTQSIANTWVGPFNLVLQNNSLTALYTARQFLEFSVNLSALGLDYFTTSSDPCSMPFRRILVKSRSSTSFAAELKDFVGPFDFFRAPRAVASASIPFFCGTAGTSIISVNNPLPTSLYTWTSPDGNIVSDPIGPSIEVNAAGSYIVSQQLMDSCGISYAKDTVQVFQDPGCVTLKTTISALRAEREARGIKLSWETNADAARFFEIERRIGNGSFSTIGKVFSKGSYGQSFYSFTDSIYALPNDVLYYRLKINDVNGNVTYSNIISLQSGNEAGMKLVKGLSTSPFNIVLTSDQAAMAKVEIFDVSGALMHSFQTQAQKGSNMITVDNAPSFKAGIYVVKLVVGNHLFADKVAIFK